MRVINQQEIFLKYGTINLCFGILSGIYIYDNNKYNLNEIINRISLAS